MKKRLLSTLLVLSMLLALLPSTAAAERAAVLEIGTAQELRAFAAEVNSGNNYTGVRVLLTADIDLGGKAEPWIPIGTGSTKPFNGTFDGNGHVITGLYFNGNLGGLFQIIADDGIVENLGVYGLITGRSFLGGIAARSKGTIRNCYSGCFIESATTLAGGITANNGGIIENCYNIGTISGSTRVGGIAGTNSGQNNGPTGYVKNCYNIGTVVGQNQNTTGSIFGSHNPIAFLVEGCYYLSGTAAQGSNNSSEGIEEKTAAQFAAQSTFSNWDFSNVWEMDVSLGRPVLRGVPEPLPATEHTHSYSADWQFNTRQHWLACDGCGFPSQIADHRFPDTWSSDSTHHWRVCPDCGYQLTVTHSAVVSVPATAPTCTTPGSTAELRCSVCGELLQSSAPVEPLGHDYSRGWSQDADNHWHTCSRCHEIQDSAPHTWRETATVSSDGLRSYFCTICHRIKWESVPIYSITVLPPTEGGSLSTSVSKTTDGISVGITATPDAYYTLDTLTVTDSQGNEVPVFSNGNNKYRFTMPASPVTVAASFRIFAGPTILISASAPAVRDEVTFTFTATHLGKPLSWDAVEIPGGDLEEVLTQCLHATEHVSYRSTRLDRDSMTFTVTGLEGNGRLYFDLPAGIVRHNDMDSLPAKIEIYVDNIAPWISLYTPETKIPLCVGEDYVEFGAKVSDALDRDIQSKLIIDSSQVDTSTPGTYTVFYTATDHAGNSTTVERTVKVVSCTGHVEDEGSFTFRPTGTTPGTKTYRCQICRSVMRTETIPAHIHTSSWVTENDTHWRPCSLCGGKGDVDGCHYVAHHLETAPDGTITRVTRCVCGKEAQQTLTVRYIHTAEELRQIAEDVNSETNEYRYTYFILANDIDLGGEADPWVPIGTDTLQYPNCNGTFRGVFDGNGHSITGLYINLDADVAHQHEQGLFGSVGYSGVVQNLSVSGSITITESFGAGLASVAGGIAGMNDGLIQNCYNACHITNTIDAGGIAGHNSYGRILNCYNTGAIFSTLFWADEGHWDVLDESFSGGITGYNYEGTIENCYNYGTVQGEAANKGGVVGGNTEANAKVVSSYYLSGTVDSAPAARRAAPRALSAQSAVSTGEERDEVDFLLEETFVDWDFAQVWTMNDSLGRPTLRSVPEGSSPQTPPEPEKPDPPDKPSGGGGGGGGGPTGGGGGGGGGGSPSPSPEPTPSVSPSPSPAPTQEPPPATVAAVTLPFADVPAGAWYRPAVAEVYARGIMAGVGPDSFAPDAPASRGMVVTLLYRMENEPSAIGRRFSDVAGEMYYTNAVVWATSSGIVTGYEDGSFRPDSTVTREQLAAMLYRYARRKGYAVSAGADLSGYRDVEQISGYALEAMKWANAQGLLTGTDWGGLAPQTETSRAEIAAILARFLEKVEGHS